MLAMTTLYLVSVGTSVVKKGHRRLGDPHWFRGSSSLKIGGNWVNYALNSAYELITAAYLSGEPDRNRRWRQRSKMKSAAKLVLFLSIKKRLEK